MSHVESTRSRRWNRKAVEKRDADAQYRLGFAFHTGSDGLRVDQVESVVWYKKAATQGHARTLAVRQIVVLIYVLHTQFDRWDG